jgi:hypothetical protein
MVTVQESRITFGTHYPSRPPGCVMCSSPTASGVYVCSKCDSTQLKRIGEISPDEREALERKENNYLAQFREKPAWQPGSGYFNISSLIRLTGRSLRWIWQTAQLSGLASTHSGHRAIWTEKQAQAFVARSGKQPGLVIVVTIRDDGSLFRTEA